jgi:hypothetical protein
MGNEVAFMKGLITGQRRLAILRWLLDCPSHSANDHVFALMLRDVALYQGRDSLRDDLEHLERAGGVVLIRHDTLTVVKLTNRGSEAAEGLVELDGVPRPGIECPY